VENAAHDGEKGAIYFLDFTSLHERTCQGWEDPTLSTSDYEFWSPTSNLQTSNSGNKCLLGHVTTYTRRKQSTACFNPLEFERKYVMQNCTCTDQDYECDFGYMRKVNHGPCVRDPTVSNDTLMLGTCPPSGFYAVSNGYRLVAGNTCKGGKQLGPTMYPCTNGVLGVSYHGWFVLFIIVGLVLGMSVITYRSKERDDAKNFGTQHFGDGDIDPTFGKDTKGKFVQIMYYIGKNVVYVAGVLRTSLSKAKSSMEANVPDSALDYEENQYAVPQAFDQDKLEKGSKPTPAYDDPFDAGAYKYKDEDFDQDDDYDDFDDENEDDSNEAELISAVAHPLPSRSTPVAVPRLNAPPSAFSDDDDDVDLFIRAAEGDSI